MIEQSPVCNTQPPRDGKGSMSPTAGAPRPVGQTITQLASTGTHPGLRHLAIQRGVTGVRCSPLWPIRPNSRSLAMVRDPLRTTLKDCWEARSPWPLFVWGQAGSGKSFAGQLLAEQAGGSIYIELGELRDMLNDAAFGRLRWSDGTERTARSLWENWRGANVAVLDELGTRKEVSDHHFETLKQAMDYRLREELPTMFISNLSPAELEKLYDERVASRLCSGTVLETMGDRRLER